MSMIFLNPAPADSSRGFEIARPADETVQEVDEELIVLFETLNKRIEGAIYTLPEPEDELCFNRQESF